MDSNRKIDRSNSEGAFLTDTQPYAEDLGISSSDVRLLPAGTRIRFIRTLEDMPDDHSPARLYAKKGQLGVITGHGAKEGYWVTQDDWPASFGASHGVDFIAEQFAAKPQGE